MFKTLPALAVILLSGCAAAPPEPTDLIYRQIPEARLQPCELPPAPLSNAELSDAFAQAYQCAELGNTDKAAIRELIE